MNNIFLTGPIQIGKSTIIRKISDQLQSYRIGGFFTESIYEKYQIIGYQIRAISGMRRPPPASSESTGDCVFPAVTERTPISNQSMVFAREGAQGVYQVGRFGIFPEAFEKIGARALARALETSQLIIMDEIGTMEQGAPKFKAQILRCLDSKIIVLGVIKQKPDGFLDALRSRTDLVLYNVDESNRNNLPSVLLKKISKYFSKR